MEKLHSAAELTEYINKVGMLPLFRIVPSLGWSAEEVVDDDCQYVVLPDGGWECKLWDWKGDIIETLKLNGSMITRDLRKACGFTEPKMRSKFDNFITRLQMGGYLVTENFVYPHDRHGKQYGWGWSLLTTPEDLFGREACHTNRTPEESRQRLMEHFKEVIPEGTEELFNRFLDKKS